MSYSISVVVFMLVILAIVSGKCRPSEHHPVTVSMSKVLISAVEPNAVSNHNSYSVFIFYIYNLPIAFHIPHFTSHSSRR